MGIYNTLISCLVFVIIVMKIGFLFPFQIKLEGLAMEQN